MEAVGGSASANSVYEKCIPSDTRKPPPDASVEERSHFIRRKYEDQEFLKPNLRMKATSRTRSHSTAEGDTPPAPSNRDSMASNRASMMSSRDSMSSRRDSLTSNRDSISSNTSLTGCTSTAGNVEVLGSLKVRIVRGRNLVVRDLLSSDPYVAATLGTQSVKTKVVNRNLNPVWDEQLLLSVPKPPQPLKLKVFDYDVLSR